MLKTIPLLFLLALCIGYSCTDEFTTVPTTPETTERPAVITDSVKFDTITYLGNRIILENRDGEYIMSGDIILADWQVDILKSNPEPNPNALVVTNSLSKRWTNAVVPYFFNSNVTNANRTRIRNVINEYENAMCYDFIEDPSGAWGPNRIEFITINNPNVGGFSKVGMVGGKQQIQLNSFAAGTIRHEIGHALGAFHEHQRPDRNNFIDILWNNIEPEFRYAFDVEPSGQEVGPFDFNSVMIYSSWAFSRNGNPTITRLNGSTFSGSNTLSPGDINGFNDLYCPGIFVKMSYVRVTDETEYDYCEYSRYRVDDIYLKFYADRAGTIPLNLPSSTTIEYYVETRNFGAQGSSYSSRKTVTVPSNQQSHYLGRHTTIDMYNDGCENIEGGFEKSFITRASRTFNYLCLRPYRQ